jgi:hypothetical protein
LVAVDEEDVDAFMKFNGGLKKRDIRAINGRREENV